MPLHQASACIRAAVESTQKTVIIEIAGDDLDFLKLNEYKICLAKKVSQEAYNVVWQSYNSYLNNNEFTWIPMYELFGTKRFSDQIQVKVETNLVKIGLGEEATLAPSGRLSAPRTGGPEQSITMINEYGSIHPGLNQVSTDLDGKLVSAPFYVATKAVALGQVTLTPVEKVLVWFEQNIQTGTMFSTARSMEVEIDLTDTSTATRRYQDGQWITP
jgi:hypothetical protein